MPDGPYPALEGDDFAATRDALHAYARLLGDGLKRCRPRRKHWWHASLCPSLRGLSTGVVHDRVPFELELDLARGSLEARSRDDARSITLRGQSARELATEIRAFLDATGAGEHFVDLASPGPDADREHHGYRAAQAAAIGLALGSIVRAMAEFRATIREETSPIQLWPHHFDLSMLWLPGARVAGENPEDAELADRQMNFGFAFGDAAIPEPYFYVTAYPFPDGLASCELPPGSSWHGEGFRGAVLRYRALRAGDEPDRYLSGLWHGLLAAGRAHLLDDDRRQSP